MKTLNELRDEALKIAVDHGFKESSFGEDMALIHSEVSEALEDFRNGANPQEMWYVRVVDDNPTKVFKTEFSINKPCGIPSELADVIIRALHVCGKHGIDIDQAISEKMEYNASRPFRHGNKKL